MYEYENSINSTYKTKLRIERETIARDKFFGYCFFFYFLQISTLTNLIIESLIKKH